MIKKGAGISAHNEEFLDNHSFYNFLLCYITLCRPIMVTSTNLNSAIGRLKDSECLMLNIYRYRSGMNNQTRYAKSAQ